MWKPEHRRAAERRGLRYPSDMTDDEGLLLTYSPSCCLSGSEFQQPGIRAGRLEILVESPIAVSLAEHPG